ncbi:ribonuclease H-like YkuK family protein [Cohnella suwonensis]|uniref:Ribonuclease H-like YkuK family protein n=1 Tax=Cohnella suwonensis TaxID=696072 RepID=A0ABW0M2M5_9BACL
MKRRRYAPIHETLFRNLSENNLNIDDVFERVRSFMEKDPRAAYQLIVGTDAQVHAGHTKFVTSIVIYRPGRGAWFCYRQVIVPREIRSLQEKLNLETTLSQEVAALIDGPRRESLEDILLPYVYQGAELLVYVDIDAGTDAKRNKTSAFVADMVGRVEAMGLTARVKPEAIGASAVANRFTKSPYRGGALSAATGTSHR